VPALNTAVLVASYTRKAMRLGHYWQHSGSR